MFGTTIVDVSGRIIRNSKNLRAMRDYARVSPVARVITRKGKNPHNGTLTVIYQDGATSSAHFASHSIMIDFVRNRRSWRNAEFLHMDGQMGYLTKPGTIAGGV